MKTRLSHLWFPAICLSFYALAVSCSSVTPHLQTGKDMVQQENWDGAVAAYRKALREDPFNDDIIKIYSDVKGKAAQAHYKKGRKFLKTKRLPEAMQEFEMHRQLSHPRVTKLEDAFSNENQFLLVMEL